MTTHEKETSILKDHVNGLIETLEKGGVAYVSGGYIVRDYEKKVINDNYHLIVRKLTSLGYDYTTNHGYGCYDYRFTKKIEL